MPGNLLHFGATVLCAHTPGIATPTQISQVVRVAHQAIVTLPTSYTAAGCGLTGSGTAPCATAQFTSAASKVTSQQQAVLLSDSQATCAPTGTPVSITSTQTVVKGV